MRKEGLPVRKDDHAPHLTANVPAERGRQFAFRRNRRVAPRERVHLPPWRPPFGLADAAREGVTRLMARIRII